MSDLKEIRSCLSEAEENLVVVGKWQEYLRKLGFSDREVVRHKEHSNLNELAENWLAFVGASCDCKIFQLVQTEVCGSRNEAVDDNFKSIKSQEFRNNRNRSWLLYDFVQQYSPQNWKDMVVFALEVFDKWTTIQTDCNRNFVEQQYRCMIMWINANQLKTNQSIVKELLKLELMVPQYYTDNLDELDIVLEPDENASLNPGVISFKSQLVASVKEEIDSETVKQPLQTVQQTQTTKEEFGVGCAQEADSLKGNKSVALDNDNLFKEAEKFQSNTNKKNSGNSSKHVNSFQHLLQTLINSKHQILNAHLEDTVLPENKGLLEQLTKHVGVLRLWSCQINENLMKMLAEVISGRNLPLSKLDLGSNNLNNCGKYLAPIVGRCKVLWLSSCNLNPGDVRHICDAVSTLHSPLSKLSLSGNDLSGCGKFLAKCFAASRELEFRNCGLKAHDIKELTNAVAHLENPTDKLVLSSNDLSGCDEAFNKLANLTQDLWLYTCNLQAEDVRFLSAAIKQRPNQMSRLTLTDNRFGEPGAQHLASCLFNIKQLDVSFCDLPPACHVFKEANRDLGHRIMF